MKGLGFGQYQKVCQNLHHSSWCQTVLFSSQIWWYHHTALAYTHYSGLHNWVFLGKILVANVGHMLAKCWQNVKMLKILEKLLVLWHFVCHRHKFCLLNLRQVENWGQTHLHKGKQIFLITSKPPWFTLILL